MVNHLEKSFFTNISCNKLNCLIGLINSVNLVISKFRNSMFDLKHNFLNNLKTRMLADF